MISAETACWNQGCGSAFISSGSGSSILGWTPIRIRIRIQSGSMALMTKNWKKLQLKKIKFFFWSKTASYRSSLQLSKEAIQHFKTWTFTNFFSFCRSFLPSWIRIHWPDWIRIQSGSGSGSATLAGTQKVAKFLLRTFTCRSTFLYGVTLGIFWLSAERLLRITFIGGGGGGSLYSCTL